MRNKNLKNERLYCIADATGTDTGTAKIIQTLAKFYYNNEASYLIDIWLNTLCKQALNHIGQCYTVPTLHHRILLMMSDLIEGQGIETVNGIEYVNTGCMYTLTVCAYEGKLFLASYEDIAGK